jgi:hypothetical protein
MSTTCHHKNINNSGFGKYTSLKPVNATIARRKVPKKTRTIKISEELYTRFREHSRRYYNVETYETILEDLLECFQEHNKDKYWFNMDR